MFFGDVLPCNLPERYEHYVGSWCLHLQGKSSEVMVTLCQMSVSHIQETIILMSDVVACLVSVFVLSIWLTFFSVFNQ